MPGGTSFRAARPRRGGERSSFARAACLPPIFASSGRTFERKDPSGPAVGRRTRSSCRRCARRRLRSRPRGRGTRMGVGALARRLRVARCDPSRAIPTRVHRWSLEQLAIVRDEGSSRRVRHARGVTRRRPARRRGQLALTLRLWSGAPVAMALRAALGGGLGRPAAAGAAASTRRPTTRRCLVLPRARSIRAACCARSTSAPSAAIG